MAISTQKYVEMSRAETKDASLIKNRDHGSWNLQNIADEECFTKIYTCQFLRSKYDINDIHNFNLIRLNRIPTVQVFCMQEFLFTLHINRSHITPLVF